MCGVFCEHIGLPIIVTKMMYAIPSQCRRTGKLNSRNFVPYRNYSAVLGGINLSMLRSPALFAASTAVSLETSLAI